MFSGFGFFELVSLRFREGCFRILETLSGLFVSKNFFLNTCVEFLFADLVILVEIYFFEKSSEFFLFDDVSIIFETFSHHILNVVFGLVVIQVSISVCVIAIENSVGIFFIVSCIFLRDSFCNHVEGFLTHNERFWCNLFLLLFFQVCLFFTNFLQSINSNFKCSRFGTIFVKLLKHFGSIAFWVFLKLNHLSFPD